MALQLPEGTRLAVSISADFNAHCVWMGTFGLSSPGYLAQETPAPGRCAPSARPVRPARAPHDVVHPLALAPDVPAPEPGDRRRRPRGRRPRLLPRAHPKLEPEEERRLMLLQLAEHERLLGRRPQGYRSPAWDFSDATLGLLEELGFVWDSSLMGHDFAGTAPSGRHRRPEAGQLLRPSQSHHRDPRLVEPRRLPVPRAAAAGRPARIGRDPVPRGGRTTSTSPTTGCPAGCSPSPSTRRRSPGPTPSSCSNGSWSTSPATTGCG